MNENEKELHKFIQIEDTLLFACDVNNPWIIDDLIKFFLSRIKEYDKRALPEKYTKPNTKPLEIAEYMAHFIIKIFIENSVMVMGDSKNFEILKKLEASL